MGHIVAALMVAVLPAGGAYGQAASTGTVPCEGLARIELPEAKVVSAEIVPAGVFTPPPNMAPWLVGDPSVYKALGAFCRVIVKATPSADSDIKIEVWMPVAKWNGKFRGQGNGGFAGEIDFRSMGVALRQGYATAGTNTGHSGAGTDASWALGHPEKVTDFGYRGIHSMTHIAKAAIKAFHGSNPQHSYFGSCSNGARR
jgi:feruloyl esterase